MNRLIYPLALLATCAAFQAQAGDNPPPGLLAKIQIATQAHQQDSQSAGREFKDMKKFVRENGSRLAHDGLTGNVRNKKHGSLDVSKSKPSRAHGAIGKGIGGRASDSDKD
jgi:hypothetical protein